VNKQTIISILVIAGVLIGMAYLLTKSTLFHPQTLPPQANTTTYFCQDSKIIAAQFSTTTVALTLSDGRSFALPLATSASGMRYEQIIAGKDIAFWGKGDTAFLTEDNQPTFASCIAGTVTTQPDGTNTFTDQARTFRFSYPAQFLLSGGDIGYTSQWMQNATTSGLLLAVVRIPQSFQPGTNFIDALFTVGTSPDPIAVRNCFTSAFGNAASTTQVTIQALPYTKIQYADAGAGNLYETTSYRTVRNNQCYAIEYTIHSSAIANYPPNQGITAFDKQNVMHVLESIVQSFAFL